MGKNLTNYLYIVLTSSARTIPSMLIKGSAALELIFFASHSRMSRPNTLQFCCPGVMFAKFVVEFMIDVSLKEEKKVSTQMVRICN